jgi:PAS domain S-box-containing protein
LTLSLKTAIESWVGPGPPFIVFLPAVTFAAWLGGLGPGLFATGLSTALCTYYFVDPVGSFFIRQGNDLFRLVVFVFEGALTSVLMEKLHEARRTSEASVAEARQYRTTLRRSEERLHTLLEHATAVIFLKDAESRYLLVNRQFEILFGLSRGEVAGKTDLDLFPRQRAEQFRAQDRAVLESGRAMHWENEIPHPDGPRTYLTTKYPLRDDDGTIHAVGGFAADITMLKRAQQHALQAERLAAIGQMMTGLAHESRNALQRGQACLEMLGYRIADRPEALDLLHGIQEAQDDLKRLYEEVRSFAAPVVISRRSGSLREVLHEAWTHLEPMRRRREATLSEQGLAHPVASFDPFHLMRVFHNILDNALAACHDPVGIIVEWAEADLEGEPAIRAAVRDNGPGLTAEQRTRLFEPFFTTKTQGTGLGLPIARRIVEAHDGRIEASPEDGPGTTILITLPRGGA